MLVSNKEEKYTTLLKESFKFIILKNLQKIRYFAVYEELIVFF